MKSGTYSLIIRLEEPRSIQVGKLGVGFFPEGYYVYVGSALNGLQQRIARHLAPRKNKHWHIDYLLEYATTISTRKIFSAEKRECTISEKVGNLSQGIPMEGFGSSDCRCRTHLYLFYENPLSYPRFETIWLQSNP
jgi:sugar fermentation stimulation protein A